MNPIVTALSGETQAVDAASKETARGGTLFVSLAFDFVKEAREEQQRNQFRILSELSRKQRNCPFPPEPESD